MKNIIFSIIIILVLCVFNYPFAQETIKSETMEQSQQITEEVVEAIRVIEIEPFTYCAVEMTGSYDQHGAGFNKLYEQAGIQNLPTDVPPFGIYLNNPNQTPVEELKWELGLIIPDTIEVKEPLKQKKWEFKQVATRMYEGAFGAEEMGQVYGEIYAWITKNAYTPAGPLMEKYLTEPEQNEDGEWVGQIEIWVPVETGQSIQIK